MTASSNKTQKSLTMHINNFLLEMNKTAAMTQSEHPFS